MRSLLLIAVGISLPLLFSAGACGGSTDASSSDAGDDARILYEASIPDDFVPYTPLTTRCVPGPYADGGIVDPDAAFVDDGGDDDAGPLLGPPQASSSGGPVLQTPTLIPITYAGDDLANQIEDFAGSIGCTDYWRTAVSEYGVGQAVMGTPVRLTDTAPTTITDAEIAAYLLKQITAGAPGFANPPTNAIFAFYFPTTTTIELQGSQSCSQSGQSFGGYHTSTRVKLANISYAVIARCNGDDIDSVTSTSTHEFIEAATDPQPEVTPAYLTTDDAHAAFTVNGGGEVGDLCENSRTADYRPDGYPFAVQRIWSNASILGGHDPCVPAPSGPYIAAIPEQPDTIGVQNLTFSGTTRGVAIAVGDSRTIDIHFHSDQASAPQWTVTANDASKFIDGTTHLTLALDTSTGTAGGIAHLTITRNSKGSVFGAEPFTLRSSIKGGNSSTWYGMVGDP